MHKLKLIIYYVLIQYLPHSRVIRFFSVIRLWYVSKVLKIMPFDKNSKFEYSIYVSDAKKLKIGKHVRINENVFLQGEIEIGDFVMIAPYVSIYTKTHNHSNKDIPMVKSGVTNTQKVVIEDNVWIGRNVTILPGIKIKEGSIIGANSVVTKSIDAFSIMGGIPAKLIRKRQG